MMPYPCNKYQQIMPSFLLSINCFEDKAIYIIKNLFRLTKGCLLSGCLVSQGELLEF